MFLVQAFRAHQREQIPVRLVNADITPEQRFAELCLDGSCSISYLTTRKFQFSELNVHCAIKNTGLANTNLVVILQILI